MILYLFPQKDRKALIVFLLCSLLRIFQKILLFQYLRIFALW